MNIFKQTHKQTSIFVTAGYPTIDSLDDQLCLLESKGIDFVEVGIPFSDPLADGPTIQEASKIAIENGMNLTLLFEQLKRRKSKIPIVLMGYFNPVLNFGIDAFLNACGEIDITSVILPDLSIEIYNRNYRARFEAKGIFPSFLVTTSTSQERIKKAVDICTNSFIYLVSSNSTTGGENNFSADQCDRLREITTLCDDTPVFIGFGIKNNDDVQKVHSISDGAIIGSSYLKAIENREERHYLDELLGVK
ncbi:MAG: tryptophan synthase subunit alpha [Crocinitomicaceae bacterium]|nr:tryptophan synthase subunit alpha [Crocinitomicaceae bacterium]MDG1657966.1 tryptophan synthase subunit alpha [Crocinitomicaceae bacterium]